MSFTAACCTLPPVSSDYQPEGNDSLQIDGMTVYECKDTSPKVMLICAYDIFGFHPNIKQFCDKLNSTGLYRVVLPDFFRGQGISEEDFKGGLAKIMEFVGERGTWGKTVKSDMVKVIEHYKKQGVTTFGCFGFCWGGKMGALSVCELEDVKGAALIHPSMLVDQDAEQAKAPVLFLPTKDDPNLIPLFEIVKKNLGEDKTEHHRFEDVSHGFCGARGDWKDDVQRQRVNEAIGITHAFFKKHLTN